VDIKSLGRRTVFPWIAALCIGLSSFAVKELTAKAHAQGLPVTLPNQWPHNRYNAPGTTDASSLLNETAPAFDLSDVAGTPHALSEWRGQVVVLNFWGFWCDTWKAELPYLKELSGQEHELGFKLAALSVDGTRLTEFEKITGGSALSFPVLLDAGGTVRSEYGVRHVPTVVIVDASGVVRYVKVGYPGNDAVLSVIRKLVSEPASLPARAHSMVDPPQTRMVSPVI